MRMPTWPGTRVATCTLIAAAVMTACSGQQPTAPLGSSSLAPKGRSESGYVVAEREPSDTTLTVTTTTVKKKPTTKP